MYVADLNIPEVRNALLQNIIHTLWINIKSTCVTHELYHMQRSSLQSLQLSLLDMCCR